jgi:hypothetical protein
VEKENIQKQRISQADNGYHHNCVKIPTCFIWACQLQKLCLREMTETILLRYLRFLMSKSSVHLKCHGRKEISFNFCIFAPSGPWRISVFEMLFFSQKLPFGMLKNVDPRRQAKLKVVPVIKHLSVFLPHY